MIKEETFDRALADLRDRYGVQFDPPSDAFQTAAQVCMAVALTKRGERRRTLMEASDILSDFEPHE